MQRESETGRAKNKNGYRRLKMNGDDAKQTWRDNGRKRNDLVEFAVKYSGFRCVDGMGADSIQKAY